MPARDLMEDMQRSLFERATANDAAEIDLDYAVVDRVYDVTPSEMTRARSISALVNEER